MGIGYSCFDIDLKEGVQLMPYRSSKQRRFMHAVHPRVAAKWDKKYGGKVIRKRKRKK